MVIQKCRRIGEGPRFGYVRPCTYYLKSVEWQAYGKTHFSWRSRLRNWLEISGGGIGQAFIGGLRPVPGHQRIERPQLEAVADRSPIDSLRRAHARAPGPHGLA